MDKIALITGASAGIGRATARKLAEHGFGVILTGRRSKLLDELEKDIHRNIHGRALSLSFDVRDNDEMNRAIDKLPADWKHIDILINNAGLAAGLDPVHKGNIEDWDQMIDTNLKGLLYLTRKIVPGMIERKSGHIVNIGSIAGKEVYPKGNVYCATKHAVDAITKGMRIDLVEHGIKVTQVATGKVETEFYRVRFNGNIEKANKVYEGFEPLKPEDIAEIILFVLTRPQHVNINDILVTSTAQANSVLTHKSQ
ncbi:MAG: SDR family NAD(P)-dependent oxidoreductase [Bacteroidota bacterium]